MSQAARLARHTARSLEALGGAAGGKAVGQCMEYGWGCRGTEYFNRARGYGEAGGEGEVGGYGGT